VIYRFEMMSEVLLILELPPPAYPLISLVEIKKKEVDPGKLPAAFVYNFYKISLKQNLHGKIKYGQGYYDFEEGGMFFKGPNQVAGTGSNNDDHTGYTMIIHPDFFLNYSLRSEERRVG